MRQVMNILVVAMLAGPALVLGQAGDVNKVLADMKAAIGGADTVAAVRSLTATGRTMRTVQSGTTVENEFELAMELPDKYMMRTVLGNMGNMSVYRNAGFNGGGLINLIDQPPMLGGGGGGGQIMVRAIGTGGAVGGGTAPTPEQQAESNRLMLQGQKREFARLVLALFGSSYEAFPLEFSFAGEAEAADGKAWVIDVTGADDFATRLFVDAKTHLPLMQSWMALAPVVMQPVINRSGDGGGRLSEEEARKMMADTEARRAEAEANRTMVEHRIYYSNFRQVNGLRLPHTLQRSVDGKPTEETTFEQFRINPKIDPRKFEVTR